MERKVISWILCFMFVFALLLPQTVSAENIGTQNNVTRNDGTSTQNSGTKDTDTENSAAENSEAEKVLTLKMAKELVVKNNPELKKQEVSLELTRIAEREAKSAFESARAGYQQTLGKVPQYEQAMTAAKLAYEMSQYAYDDSKLQLEDFKKELAYNAERMYLSLLNLDNIISSAEAGLRLQRELVQVETLKLQLGLTTNYQYELQKQAVMDTEKQLQTLYNSRQTLKWQFNRMLGRHINTPLNLMPVAFEPVNIGNRQEVLNKAQEELLAIAQFNRTIEDKYDDKENYKYKASDKAEKLEFEIAQTKLLKEDVEQTVQLAVNTAFDNMELCKKSLVDARANYNMVHNNNQNLQKQYELGLISQLELKGSALSLQQSQNAYEEAVNNYYLAARKLELAQGGILMN